MTLDGEPGFAIPATAPAFVKEILTYPAEKLQQLLQERKWQTNSLREVYDFLDRKIKTRKEVEKYTGNVEKIDQVITELAHEIRWRQLEARPLAVSGNKLAGEQAPVDANAGQVPRQLAPVRQGGSVGARNLSAAQTRAIRPQALAVKRGDTLAATQAAAGAIRTGPASSGEEHRCCEICQKRGPVSEDGNLPACAACRQNQATLYKKSAAAASGRLGSLQNSQLPPRSGGAAAGTRGGAAAAPGRDKLPKLRTDTFYRQTPFVPPLVKPSDIAGPGTSSQQQPAAISNGRPKRGLQQQALAAVVKRPVSDAGDEDHARTGRRGEAGSKPRGRRLAPPEPEDKEPIDLADTSDEEGKGDRDGDQRLISGKSAGPGPSSAAAAAAGQAADTARGRTGSFRSLSVQLAGLKCYFPPEGGKHSVEVSAEDLARLEKGEFLNDTCIDFYIKYIEHHLPSAVRPRYHFFNSFFLKKLQEKPGKKVKKAEQMRLDHERVKKWTKHVDLFSKDYIFVPIHGYLHWSLVLICHPGNVVYQAGLQPPGAAQGPEPVGSPLLLHLDSLDGNHAPKAIFEALRSYLEHEWVRKATDETHDSLPRRWAKQYQDAGAEPPRVAFSPNTLPGLSMAARLPKQNNHTDCGLFLLSYIDFFVAANPHYIVTEGSNAQNVHTMEPDTAACNRETLLQKTWFDKRNAARLRDHLRALICGLMLPLVSEEDERRKTLEGVVDEYRKKPHIMGARYLEPVEYLKFVSTHPNDVGLAVDDDVLSNGSEGEEPTEDPKDVLQSPLRHMTRAASKRAGVEPLGPMPPPCGNKRRKVQQPAAESSDPSSHPDGTGNAVVDLSSPDKVTEGPPPAAQDAPAGESVPEGGQALKGGLEDMDTDGGQGVEDEEGGNDGVLLVVNGTSRLEHVPDPKPSGAAAADQAGGGLGPVAEAPAAKRRKAKGQEASGSATGRDVEAMDVDDAIGKALAAADLCGALGAAAATGAAAEDRTSPADEDSDSDGEPPPSKRRGAGRSRHAAAPHSTAGAAHNQCDHEDLDALIQPETLPQKRPPVSAAAASNAPYGLAPSPGQHEDDALIGPEFAGHDAAAAAATEDAGGAQRVPRPSGGKRCHKIKKGPVQAAVSAAAGGADAMSGHANAAAAGRSEDPRPAPAAEGDVDASLVGVRDRGRQAACDAAEPPVNGLVPGDAACDEGDDAAEDPDWLLLVQQQLPVRTHIRFPDDGDEPEKYRVPVSSEERDDSYLACSADSLRHNGITADDATTEQPDGARDGHGHDQLRAELADATGTSGAGVAVSVEPQPNLEAAGATGAADVVRVPKSGELQRPVAEQTSVGFHHHDATAAEGMLPRPAPQGTAPQGPAGAGAAPRRRNQPCLFLRRHLAAGNVHLIPAAAAAAKRAASSASEPGASYAVDAGIPDRPRGCGSPGGRAGVVAAPAVATVASPQARLAARALSAAGALAVAAPAPAAAATAAAAAAVSALPTRTADTLSADAVGDGDVIMVDDEDELDPDLRANLDYPESNGHASCSQQRSEQQPWAGRPASHAAQQPSDSLAVAGARTNAGENKRDQEHHHQRHGQRHQHHHHHEAHHERQRGGGKASRLGGMSELPLHRHSSSPVAGTDGAKAPSPHAGVQGAVVANASPRGGASPSHGPSEHRGSTPRGAVAQLLRTAGEQVLPESTLQGAPCPGRPSLFASAASVAQRPIDLNRGPPAAAAACAAAAAAAAAAAPGCSPADGGHGQGPARVLAAQGQGHPHAGAGGSMERPQASTGPHSEQRVDRIKKLKKKMQAEYTAMGGQEHLKGIPDPRRSLSGSEAGQRKCLAAAGADAASPGCRDSSDAGTPPDGPPRSGGTQAQPGAETNKAPPPGCPREHAGPGQLPAVPAAPTPVEGRQPARPHPGERHPHAQPGQAPSCSPVRHPAGAPHESAAMAKAAAGSPAGSQPLLQLLLWDGDGSADHTDAGGAYLVDDGGSVGTDDEGAQRTSAPASGGAAGEPAAGLLARPPVADHRARDGAAGAEQAGGGVAAAATDAEVCEVFAMGTATGLAWMMMMETPSGSAGAAAPPPPAGTAPDIPAGRAAAAALVPRATWATPGGHAGLVSPPPPDGDEEEEDTDVPPGSDLDMVPSVELVAGPSGHPWALRGAAGYGGDATARGVASPYPDEEVQLAIDAAGAAAATAATGATGAADERAQGRSALRSPAADSSPRKASKQKPGTAVVAAAAVALPEEAPATIGTSERVRPGAAAAARASGGTEAAADAPAAATAHGVAAVGMSGSEPTTVDVIEIASDDDVEAVEVEDGTDGPSSDKRRRARGGTAASAPVQRDSQAGPGGGREAAEQRASRGRSSAAGRAAGRPAAAREDEEQEEQEEEDSADLVVGTRDDGDDSDEIEDDDEEDLDFVAFRRATGSSHRRHARDGAGAGARNAGGRQGRGREGEGEGAARGRTAKGGQAANRSRPSSSTKGVTPSRGGAAAGAGAGARGGKQQPGRRGGTGSNQPTQMPMEAYMCGVPPNFPRTGAAAGSRGPTARSDPYSL